VKILFKGEDLGHWSGLPTLQEARRIKQELNVTPMKFVEMLGEMDGDATCMLVAILKTRKDPSNPVNLEDVEGEFDDLEQIRDAEELAEAEAEGKDEPPTQLEPKSRTRKPSAKRLSSISDSPEASTG
jgi:hypothetical protein